MKRFAPPRAIDIVQMRRALTDPRFLSRPFLTG